MASLPTQNLVVAAEVEAEVAPRGGGVLVLVLVLLVVLYFREFLDISELKDPKPSQ